MRGQPSTILVLAEMAEGKPAPIALELLGLAKHLGQAKGRNVSAVVLGHGAAAGARQLISSGADHVYFADGDAVNVYQADAWIPALMDVIRTTSPRLVLCGHTNTGADLAPRLAFRVAGSVATNCEAVHLDNDKLLVTRPCYGAKARAMLWLKELPAVVTVRSKSQTSLEPDPNRVGTMTEITGGVEAAAVRTRVIERREYPVKGRRLETAKIVVAGGRGLGGPEGFRLVEALAESLGAVVGASRVACDLGWCSPSMQIGLTGKIIAPDLYVAIGISGASQHMAGCAGAKAIVAINADPEAPIFDEARFGVVGDYKELLPKFIEEVQRHKAD
jgi:electron transfer flavoprotein alpha subunit